MARKKASGGRARQLKLDSVLDLRAAAPLAEQLGKLRGAKVAVNASDVERVGAQCVQVLLSAKKTWDDAGDSFALTNPSDAFLEGLDVLGLSQSHFEKAQP